MNVKSLYDTVVLTNPCSHNTFLTHVDTTIRSLISRYGMNYVCAGGYERAKSVEDAVSVYDEYYSAILDNVLYLLTGDDSHKVDYVNDADNGYKAVWRRKSHGVSVKDRRFARYV